MTSEGLKGLLAAKPFKPFRIHMGGGREIDVGHPELVLVIPSGRLAIIAKPGVDAVELVDVFMIQSIEVLPRKASGNGKRRRAS